MTVLILAALFLLCACHNYEKHQVDFLGNDFSWDFNKVQALKWIEAVEKEAEIKAKVVVKGNFVQDQLYTVRFSEETGKIDMVKFHIGSNATSLLTAAYGCLRLL